MSLHELFLKYNSDKAEHGYAEFYEQHLPKDPKKILEIGVKDGASILAFKEYFPDAEIHGLDLFSEFIPTIEGVKLWTGNQIDYKVLELLRNENFDIIIDDGSHNSRDQMMTFFGLFNGKHYFIEDLQCCNEEFYRQGLPFAATAESLLKRLTGYVGYDILFDDNIILIQCS